MRVEVWVRPSASVTSVGGSRDGALVIRVVEAPERGRATAAAIAALADALDVPRRSVSLLRGATSNRKVLEVSPPGGDDARIARRLADLAVR